MNGLQLNMQNHIVNIDNMTITVKEKAPKKGSPCAVLTKTYSSQQALRVLIGRLMGKKDPEGFLSMLICRIKQDLVREGKL
jgi:hypothetical protein